MLTGERVRAVRQDALHGLDDAVAAVLTTRLERARRAAIRRIQLDAFLADVIDFVIRHWRSLHVRIVAAVLALQRDTRAASARTCAAPTDRRALQVDETRRRAPPAAAAYGRLDFQDMARAGRYSRAGTSSGIRPDGSTAC